MPSRQSDWSVPSRFSYRFWQMTNDILASPARLVFPVFRSKCREIFVECTRRVNCKPRQLRKSLARPLVQNDLIGHRGEKRSGSPAGSQNSFEITFGINF